MRYMNEIKDFDVLAGTDIKQAVTEARKIAEMNDCIVRFDFNGITMKIYDFTNIEDEVNYYHHRLGEK